MRTKYLLVLVLFSVTDAYIARFFLSTKQNQDNLEVAPNNASLFIKNDLPVLVLIHGWGVTSSTPMYSLLSQAFFSQRNYSVVKVDYDSLSTKDYLTAVAGAPEVACQIENFITSTRIPLKNFHLIGHSLGAQIAGYVGRRIYKAVEKKLARITALDPAGPYFEPPVILGENIQKTDATVVLVIHTNDFVEGYPTDCGSLDAYPNGGGPYQPGCLKNSTGVVNCSHNRAWSLFSDAVQNPGSVMALQCENVSNFEELTCDNNKKIDIGGNITSADEGRSYLTTTAQSPFKSIHPPPKQQQ